MVAGRVRVRQQSGCGVVGVNEMEEEMLLDISDLKELMGDLS
jgi:hypothetical protein